MHADAHGIYGSRKIARAIARRDDLESACRNTVAAAMREMGLRSRVRRGVRPTTTQVDPARPVAENKLGGDFTAEAPNRKWVADITYPRTAAAYTPKIEGQIHTMRNAATGAAGGPIACRFRQRHHRLSAASSG